MKDCIHALRMKVRPLAAKQGIGAGAKGWCVKEIEDLKSEYSREMICSLKDVIGSSGS